MGASGIEWDRVTVIEVWVETSQPSHRERLRRLQALLLDMGRALRQEAVGAIIRGRLKIILCEVRR